MASTNSTPSAQSKGSPLRTPPKIRTQGLGTIAERLNTPTAPPIPRRSSRRKSTASPKAVNRPGSPKVWTDSDRSSQDTGKTAPPAYEWAPETLHEEEGNLPVEGEKLAELRRDGGWRRPKRGGWGRIALIAGVVLLLILALAVGLGVGLSQKKKGSGESGTTNPSSQLPPQQFPLGQYSLVTALMGVETACTSNPATWRCYPFAEFDAGDTTNTTSLASFNWVISNTSSTYATANSVSSTPDSGIAANLTVASTTNPFGITFDAKPLTYISSASNASSPRYTFSFTSTKLVIPDTAISSDGSTSECFFDQTIFTGNIYLSAARDYPSGSLAKSTSLGGYEQWPYAVEVTQTAYGAANVPNCYKTVNGHKGAPITDFTPMPGNDACLCDYRNYS